MSKVKTCDECNGKIENKKVEVHVYEVSLGKFDAFVCKSCGQELFTEEVSEQIDDVAKKRGLWGLESHTKIGQAGDSLILRINKQLALFLGLKKGDDVTLIPESKHKISVSL